MPPLKSFTYWRTIGICAVSALMGIVIGLLWTGLFN